MQKKILVGIDLGTTTLKAVFLDASLSKIVTTQVEEIFPAQVDNPQYIEYDPMDWWNGTICLFNFIGNKKQIKSGLLSALIKWRKGKTGMPFSTEASINLADDPELMRLMVEAGFDTIFVGIETPNEDSLTECSKSQNKGRDLVASVKQLQRAGLQVQGGFIVGFDNDSPSIFQQQIDFIQKSGIVTAMVGLLQAPLGTRLYERMQKEGRLVNKFSGDNVDGSTNIIPRMGLEPLREGYRKVLHQLYAPKFYYERVLTFLREYQPRRIRVH